MIFLVYGFGLRAYGLVWGLGLSVCVCVCVCVAFWYRGKGLGYRPHPVTVKIRRPIKRYTEPYYIFIQLLLRGGSTQCRALLFRIRVFRVQGSMEGMWGSLPVGLQGPPWLRVRVWGLGFRV